MEVILLQKIENLGNLGDKVRVRNGYARNYLVPYGKARFATAENIAAFEVRRAELERSAAESLAIAQARAEKLADLRVTIPAKVGTEGKLFGSVGGGDIADAICAAGIEVEKREVRLPEGPIHQVGEYAVDLHLHADVNTTVTVVVAAEEG